jgi:hypothetical protein
MIMIKTNYYYPKQSRHRANHGIAGARRDYTACINYLKNTKAATSVVEQILQQGKTFAVLSVIITD